MKKILIALAFVAVASFSSQRTLVFAQESVPPSGGCQIVPKQGKTYTAGLCIDTTNTCIALGPPAEGENPLTGDCFAEV
jgi:hypothetical protein